MSKKVYLSPPHMVGEEFKYVKEAFDSNWISPTGPLISEFEEDLCKYTRARYAVALSSGTAAIHLSLIVLGVQPGDDVICSTFTFAGSAFPIKYVGANPVFVDSEQETWNMDPNLLEKAIQERRKIGNKVGAIILVHLYGMPAKIKQIKTIADRYEIPLIEDAAEALGSRINGTHVGTFGDIGILSFNGNKIITTSGGGAVLTENPTFADAIKHLSTQAREPKIYYEHQKIGFNYRLSNVCAGIGRGQIANLDTFIKKRREIFDTYKAALASDHVKFLSEANGFFSNRWLTTVKLRNTNLRDRIIQELEAWNIESRPLWKPMHEQPVFKNSLSYLSDVSSNLFKTGLCLPSGSNLQIGEQEKIIEIVQKRLT